MQGSLHATTGCTLTATFPESCILDHAMARACQLGCVLCEASSAATARELDCREVMEDRTHLGVLCSVESDVSDIAFCLSARVAGSDVCVLRQG